MTKKVLFSIVLILLSLQNCFAQHDSTKAQIDKAYIKSYFIDTKNIALAPLHFSETDWQKTLLIGVVGVGLSTADLEIHNFFQSNRSHFSNEVSQYGLEPFGSGEYSLPLLGAFYIEGLWTGNEKSKAVAMMGVKAFAITGLYGQVLKTLIHRHRPYQVYGDEVPLGVSPSQYEFAGPLKGFQYTSLPSGHSIAAFSVATILAKSYSDEPWVAVVAYTIATGTGLSRINDNDHWASDVLFGAAIGTAMGTFIYNQNSWGISVLPYYGNSAAGASLQMPIK